jgi:NAD(P)-dependent dehydrogenase (short-subunit alcohol dehydrogenase family)
VLVAVLTGAGSGIGRACAVALSQHDFAIVLAGRRRQALEETAGLCRRHSSEQILVVPTDVRSEQAVEELFAAAANRLGRIDVLFNNAGIFGPSAPVENVTLADWDDVVATNLTAQEGKAVEQLVAKRW